MAQHPMKVVLLDLDGTLTKSDGGIIASVVKTFEELGRPVPDDAELHRFIGPAIIESLRRNHVPEDELDRAVTIYRSYYADRAVFDDPNEPGNKVPGRLVNVVFPGIREQLLKLRADGYYLALASCKPEYQCVPICEHFHLTELLDGIYGASRDNSRLDKDQVIRYCFDKIGFDAAAGDKAVMIGDRYTDIDGARWNVVESEDKRKARINMIHHLLSSIPYTHVERPELKFPKRPPSTGYRRTDRALQLEVPDFASTLKVEEIPEPYVDVEDEPLPNGIDHEGVDLARFDLPNL